MFETNIIESVKRGVWAGRTRTEWVLARPTPDRLETGNSSDQSHESSWAQAQITVEGITRHVPNRLSSRNLARHHIDGRMPCQ